jgi:hypothetical protein
MTADGIFFFQKNKKKKKEIKSMKEAKQADIEIFVGFCFDFF